MTYFLEILTQAQKSMSKFPRKDSENLKKKILQLSQDPRPRWSIKLKGQSGHRISVGNYRIIYIIDEKKMMITIIDIGNRKDVYKN